MAREAVRDRRADAAEVSRYRTKLRTAAARSGLENLRLRDDGTVIVHAPDPGYRAVVRFAGDAARLVGAYVHVITDDVPAGQVDAPSL